MQASLVESLRQRSRFAVADTVDASLRARCFASLKCIPTLTLICHFIDGIKAGDFARAESVRFEFQPAKIGMNISSPPALYLHSSRLMNRRTF
jgi:hypothetical protein